MSAALNEPADLHAAVNQPTASLDASQGAAQADSQKATA